MWTDGTSDLQRQTKAIRVCKDALGPFVDFVFGETIYTIYLTGFIPDVVARAEWAFAVGHHEIRL